MKKSFKKYEKAGLPGGPNELKRFTQGFIISQRGQWDYPGLPTAVPTPTGKITMKGVEDDLLGIDNLGNAQYMTPGNNYQFEGDMVYEIPMGKKGGIKKPSKKYSKSLMSRNILFTKNPLLKKPKSVKNKIFDPNSPYFEPGGEIEYNQLPEKYKDAFGGVLSPKDLDPDTLKKYLSDLRSLENSIKKGYRNNKWYPHSSIEGGANTIAYGHKLQPGESFSSGLTEQEARDLQKKDVLAHQTKAEKFVDDKYGKGTYDKLPQNSQMLLTDYAYNLGSLNKFPSFVEGVVKGDKDKMLKEYERRGLSERNKWTKNVINTTDFSKKSNNNSQYLYDISVLLNNLLSGMFHRQDGGELSEASYGHSIGNLIRKQPGGETDLPQNVGITYLSEDDRSYYSPLDDTIYLNPNASDAELNHELVHAWQNRTGRLRSNPNLPQQRPPIVASDEQAASYYTRKGDEVDQYLSNLKNIYPEMTGNNWTEDLNRFLPDQIKYDKAVEPLMYQDPNTMEGEAEYLSQTRGRPPGISFRQDGGAMNAMMKARLAYANEFGNPAAKRMIVTPDQPYDFGDGNYGTHYMASMDNYAVPQIQDENGQLALGDYGPESNEAIRFDRPEDAEYFAKNYKNISPGFIELELDDNQIEEYRKGGYIIEDISIPSLTRMDKGGNPIKQLQEKEKAAELSRLIASGAASGLGGMASYVAKEISKSQNKPSSNGSPARATAKPKMLAAVEKLASAPKTKSGDVNLAVRDFVQDAKEIDLKSKKDPYKDPYKEKDKIIYVDGDKMELKYPDADARYKQWVMNIEDKNKNQSYFEDFGDWINENIFGAESDIERAYRSTYNPVKPKTYYYNGRQVTGNGPWNNWGDAPVQMVYPEMFFMGPSGGAAGIAGNTLKSGFNYGKNVIWPALNTALPLGEGITTATAGKVTPFNIASLIFGSQSAANLADPNSESRKSLEKAYNNPTTSNILDAVGNVGLDALGILGSPGVINMFGAAPKAISNLGEFITTKTPLKNTYKYNPWAFKPNPEAAYRMIGDEAGLKDALESGYFRPSSQGSDIKIIHPETYYTMGVPSDTRKYFGHVWDRGYPGPYMTEVSNAAKDSRFTPLNTYFGSGKDLGDIVYTNPEKFIPINEATIYKQHWLKGYKKIDVPKQLPGSPNSKFQSEIDWQNWVKYKEDFHNNPNVIQELNDIEKANKEAGTWMKNADGTPFQGTPEQFVLQQSTNWKNAFPEYYGETLTTRSKNQFNTFNKSKFGTTDEGWHGEGIYTYPTQQVKQKGTGLGYGTNEYELYVNSANKGVAEGPYLKGSYVYQKDTNKLMKDFYDKYRKIKESGNWNADVENSFNTEYEYLNKYINAAKENNINEYTTLRVPSSENEVVIPFSNRVKSAKGNILFDMTNPNIYKSMLPYIIPTGLGVGAAAYGANDGANYKSGGLIEKKSSLLKADDGIEISDNSLFNDKLQEIADELGVTVDDLVGIMQHESRLNPSAVNPYTGAVGLIQFMPNTAKGLGTSIDALKQMSAVDQLDYVKKFYKPIAGKAKDIGDLYMYTFLPAAVGKPDDFVIGVKGSDSKVFGINQDALYKQNAVFDSEKKGYYTVGDVKKRISNFTGKSLTAPNRKKTIKRIPGKVEDTVKVIKRKHYVDSDKKEETIPVDPRIEQLAAFSKIMAPTSENIFQLYNQGISSQMKYGGLTKMDKGGGIQGIEGLKEDFADRLSQFINDAKSQGINLKIGSGYRSYEKQKQLWEDALKKYGSAEVARKWVAPPGSSYHNKGLAVDLHDENSRALGKEENQEATAWAHANAKKYGLHFRMGNEPWHIEPIEFTGEDDEHTDENDITGDILIPDLQTESKVEYDDDYSDWSPNKKEVVTSDPRLQQLEAFSKIISPSSQNINMMFQDAIKGNMKKGGFILEVDDRDIQKYLDGGYIVEEID